MQTDKIALIAPNQDFTLRAVDLFRDWGERIHVAMASGKDVIAIAQQLSEKGADVLICYATFDEAVKTTVSIPTVSLRPGVLDILRGVQQTKNWLAENKEEQDNTKLVVGLSGDSIVDNATLITDIVGLKTKVLSGVPAAGPDEIAAIVSEVPNIAALENVQPEFITNGIPVFPVAVGREALLQSVRQARELVAAGRANAAKLKQFQAIMEFTGEGIVAIDSRRQITYMNHAAEKMLKTSEEQVNTNLAAAFLADINLDDTLHYGQTRIVSLTGGDQQALACRVVPMIVGGQTIGAVLTITEAQFVYKDKWSKDHGGKGYKAVYHFDDFITANASMKETIAAAKNYAGVDSTILINGDTGTGKEIIAQSIHNYSRRSGGPFVAVNCAALPESLLESELFGYEYGAFTGARKNGKKGLFEQADQGTIFLDEIGEISLSIQARLLRVIQQREIMRIGGDKIIPVDVGVIAATHRDLPELIAKGLFRRDLYHRLSILRLKLLPLAARQEDIPCLVEKINHKLAAKLLKRPLQFSAPAWNILNRYQWPGNVRELESVIERLMILKQDYVVTGNDLERVLDSDCDRQDDGIRLVPKGTMQEMEQSIIRQVLQETGSHEHTAKILGISTTTIWRKTRTFQNERSNFKMKEE
ncbi:sigma 54-interacting transcriptional regulator [Sporomusa termitida]|uniref:Anaerobic nitric oxide reductase transcription regulator NorR n=1 Tax=Sporomusa termitida TaxID=2377 RepID=A0A517DPS7_9FIRM|nr:sigma 54-interacting transcriptional regulator [Sporomusa termitida]QDR79364.1 Anaerobic nitric oxide reductase transcription regulator NorR [Sporomusa termitida]